MGPGADLWGRGLFPYRSLDALSSRGRGGGAGNAALPIAAVILSLRDLIGYFRAPHTELQHEQRQSRLRSLRRRQDLFQQEVPPHSACGAVMGLWGGYGVVGMGIWGCAPCGAAGLRSASLSPPVAGSSRPSWASSAGTAPGGSVGDWDPSAENPL